MKKILYIMALCSVFLASASVAKADDDEKVLAKKAVLENYTDFTNVPEDKKIMLSKRDFARKRKDVHNFHLFFLLVLRKDIIFIGNFQKTDLCRILFICTYIRIIRS